MKLTIIFEKMRSYFPNIALLSNYRGIVSYTFRKHFSDDVGEVLASTANVKKVRNRKELTPDEKRKVMIRWHKTNQQLFGPVVQEEKHSKTTDSPKTKKRDGKSSKKADDGALIPINLWRFADPSSFRTRKLSKVKREQTPNHDSDRLNSESTDADVNSKINQKNNTQNPKNNLEATEITATPAKSVVSHLPQNPFYTQGGILYPFPLMINKPASNPSSSEIYSLQSQKLAIPSVTEILSKTRSDASELALAVWRKKKIAEVGEDGLEEFMKETKLTGSSLHTSIETCLRGVPYENVAIEPRTSGHWLSLKNILKELGDVVAVETHVAHPYLRYKGFIDCVAHYRGSLVLVDWKTSQKIKTTLNAAYDDPVQIAAYMGALNADDNYPFEVENALLVVAYPTGRPADVHVLNREKCDHYWVEWLKRLELYERRKKQGLLDRPPLFT